MDAFADPAVCPLCRRSNHCPMVGDSGCGTKCWCAAEGVPAALLEQIPTHLRRQACVCQECVVAYRREREQPEWPSLATIVQERLNRVRRDK